MDAKKAVLVAFALAVVLPYVTVAFMQTGRFGIAAVTALFLGAFLLVIYSESDKSSDAGKSSEASGSRDAGRSSDAGGSSDSLEQ